MPVRFERCRADDQDPGDSRLPGKELGYPYALNGFAKTHIIGKNRPSHADGKGDSIELIGQEFCFEKGFSKGMPPGFLRISAIRCAIRSR